MAEYFNKGFEIPLANGSSVKIIEKLGEGGQGVVYKVSYNGKNYALKWYHVSAQKNLDAFYENLKQNVEKGSPTDHFIWPLYLTQKVCGSFGYIMQLRPSGYFEFSEFLLAKVHFSGLNAVVNAALNITNGFRELHRAGYSYQDLNDGNFFIRPDDGDVLICDNDNVAPDRENLGIAGKARYMAPEVVRSIAKPDNYTDRFSLAVILFRLLFLDHPLEGEIVAKAPCITEALELKYYGKAPVFIFDEHNDTNRPVPSIHRNVIKLWKIYPEFIKQLFKRSFSWDAMNADDMEKVKRTRVMDNEWQQAFIRLRDSIIKCSCTEETFLDIDSQSKCINCGRSIPKQWVLNCRNGKYKIPLFPGKKLFACHIDESDYNSVVGEITVHPQKPGVWGIKNISGKPWTLILADGTIKSLENESNFSIVKIAEIKFDLTNVGKIEKGE